MARLFTYSLCHASYRTYGRSKQVRDYWLKLATFPERVQHFLGFEITDDGVSREYGIEATERLGTTRDGKTQFITTEPNESVSAIRNWNASASIATGDFLLAIADDLVPNPGWDEHLDTLLGSLPSEEFIATFSDDRCSRMSQLSEDTLLPRHPLMSRKLYMDLGYLFSPEYDSAGPDFDLLIMALKRGLLLDCREIKFHHSIGPVLSDNDQLICGCKEQRESSKRTLSQNQIHAQPEKVWKVIKSRWNRFDIALGKLACINRIASYVYSSMRFGKKNYPIILILKSLSYYTIRFSSSK
jgi:hypothetical protein